ncbi:PREDICTED: ribonuclease P protein subunit p29 [Gekko japonicus]|uniref:Ribonuclease P protein subunit p29 n=1 Tax=Gekko japonicus TaxID=146911 RepID=A0ABM1K7D9_GEKJA|nr:PREDICTED: ribonuclease P protein subunit p29 [Gekko japonicus]
MAKHVNMERVLYNQLPQQTAKLVNIQPQRPKEADAFVKAFLKRSLTRKSDIEDILTRKAVVLEHLHKRRRRERKTRGKGFSAKQRRERRLFDIKPEHQRYEMFLPLHELWKQYIRDLCNGLKPEARPQMIQAKLLKADLHGALVTVIPKLNNVFSMEIDGFVSYIFGSKIQFKASERSAKKFKSKGTIDL